MTRRSVTGSPLFRPIITKKGQAVQMNLTFNDASIGSRDIVPQNSLTTLK